MLSVKINRLKCQTETYTIRSKFVGHRSMFKRCYFDGDAHWKSKVFTPKLEQQLVAPVKDPLESCQYQEKANDQDFKSFTGTLSHQWS